MKRHFTRRCRCRVLSGIEYEEHFMNLVIMCQLYKMPVETHHLVVVNHFYLLQYLVGDLPLSCPTFEIPPKQVRQSDNGNYKQRLSISQLTPPPMYLTRSFKTLGSQMAKVFLAGEKPDLASVSMISTYSNSCKSILHLQLAEYHSKGWGVGLVRREVGC